RQTHRPHDRGSRNEIVIRAHGVVRERLYCVCESIRLSRPDERKQAAGRCTISAALGAAAIGLIVSGWKIHMKDFNFRPGLSIAFVMAAIAAVLFGSPPLRAQSSPAVAHIQTYYQQLMPTIQQAGRLSVRERDKRFTPAIMSAFDLATMTRLAVGPT